MNKYRDLFNRAIKSSISFNQKPLFVDGTNNFIRSFSGYNNTNSNGVHCGAIVGFLLSLSDVIDLFLPSRVIIFFDGYGGSTARKMIDPEYKSHRSNNKIRLNRVHYSDDESERDSLISQFAILNSLLENLPVSVVSLDNVEADDSIALSVELFKKNSDKICILSTDKDFYQLLDDKSIIYSPVRNMFINESYVLEKFGILSSNFAIYKSICSDDKSDNIKGVRGIGIRTLLKHMGQELSNRTVSLEEFFTILESKEESRFRTLVLQQRDLVERNYKIVQLYDTILSPNSISNIISAINSPIPSLNMHNISNIIKMNAMSSVLPYFYNFFYKTFSNLQNVYERDKSRQIQQ